MIKMRLSRLAYPSLCGCISPPTPLQLFWQYLKSPPDRCLNLDTCYLDPALLSGMKMSSRISVSALGPSESQHPPVGPNTGCYVTGSFMKVNTGFYSASLVRSSIYIGMVWCSFTIITSQTLRLSESLVECLPCS